METKKSTGEEEVVLSQASSPSNYGDARRQSEDQGDFVSLMDENGIIGLLEALEIVGVEEYSDGVESEHKVPPVETQVDKVGYNWSRSLSHDKSPGEDVQTLSQSPVSPTTATCEQHHLTSTHEEILASPGIDDGSFLDLSFTEGLQETQRSFSNLRPCFSPPPMSPEKTLSGIDGTFVNGSHYSDRCSQPPTPSPRTIKQRTPGVARSSASFGTDSFENTSSRLDRDSRNPITTSKAAPLNKSNKNHPNGCAQDYSKVKPRVNFPKVSYKPPKSRLCSKRESLSSRPPSGCKSLAESVKEVRPTIPAPSGDVQELGSPREASRLLSELEENYNKLWIKYAEAENTIDHLRLAAKVNLYSDGPKPGHSVPSIYNHEASKFMMLNFPQAQRAETSSVCLYSDADRTTQNPLRDPPDSPVILYSQVNELLEQLQIFEDLLKDKKLRPDEQQKELSQLFEGLRSLESSYLVAKDEHKLLQKEEENSAFDPDRELEGLIFDCVLYMDELKEHVEQIQEDLLTHEPPPSPICSPSPSEGRETLTQPQKTCLPSLVDPKEGAAVMFRSISDERDGDEAQKETFNSPHLKTVNGKCEVNILHTDSPSNFRGISQSVDLLQKNEPLPTSSKADTQPGESEEDGPNHGIENLKVKEYPQQRILSPDETLHRYTSTQPSRQPSVLDPSSRKDGLETRTSHSSSLSSLGEIAALEKRNSKLQSGSCRLPSQDGIVFAETDSGFNGTESSHPTPTGAPSPLHQGAVESISVVQERNPKSPRNGLVTSPDPYSLLPSCCAAPEVSTTSKLNSNQPRKTKSRKGQRRKTFTYSHLSWTKKRESGTSDIESSSSSVTEDGQIGCYSESVTSLSPSSSSSSQRWRDTKVRRSSEVTDNSLSMQMLHAEVSRIHEKLEICLKERERLASATATTVQENRHHPRTSTPRDSSRTMNTHVRAAVKKTPSSDRKQRDPPDACSVGSSDHPHTQCVVSRCTQTSSAASDNCSSHTNAIHMKHRSVSVQTPETSDKPDTRDLHHHHAPCLHCVSHQQTQAQAPASNSTESIHSCRCHHCHHYGSTNTDRHRLTHNTTNLWHQPAEAVKCCAAAAPPAPLQYLCPLPVLLCSSPSCASPSNRHDTAKRVRSRKEARSQAKCSPSADRQDVLDCSLNKAIRAARHMRSTSGHMSHSLRFGLHQQQQLLTPLMTQLSQRQMSN